MLIMYRERLFTMAQTFLFDFWVVATWGRKFFCVWVVKDFSDMNQICRIYSSFVLIICRFLVGLRCRIFLSNFSMPTICFSIHCFLFFCMIIKALIYIFFHGLCPYPPLWNSLGFLAYNISTRRNGLDWAIHVLWLGQPFPSSYRYWFSRSP